MPETSDDDSLLKNLQTAFPQAKLKAKTFDLRNYHLINH